MDRSSIHQQTYVHQLFLGRERVLMRAGWPQRNLPFDDAFERCGIEISRGPLNAHATPTDSIDRHTLTEEGHR